MDTFLRRKRKAAAASAAALLIEGSAFSQAVPLGSEGAAAGDSSLSHFGLDRSSSVNKESSVEVRQQQQETDGLLSSFHAAALEGDSNEPLLLPLSSIDEDVFQYPVDAIMASDGLVWLPSQRHANQRGSGEKYEKLLSKGSDFEHLPERHPARLQADSRAIRRQSFHTVFAGIVLATAYVAFYLYQTSGAGVRTHAERHTLALNRVSSTTSGLIWVAAWRLWTGLVLSGVTSLALNAYRIDRACNRSKDRVPPMWLVEHWKLLVGVPLLLLLLASGKGTQLVVLDNAAAVGSSTGLLRNVLAHSSPASDNFLLDAFLQAPFGLVMVGVVRLLMFLGRVGRRRLESHFDLKKQQRKPIGTHRFKTEEGENMSLNAMADAVQTLEALLPFRDRSETRTRGSATNKKNKNKMSLSEHSGMAELHAQQAPPLPTETSHSVPKARRRRLHARNRQQAAKHTQGGRTTTAESFTEPLVFEEVAESKEESEEESIVHFELQEEQKTHSTENP